MRLISSCSRRSPSSSAVAALTRRRGSAIRMSDGWRIRLPRGRSVCREGAGPGRKQDDSPCDRRAKRTACRSVETEGGLEPERQSRMLDHPADAPEHARHERLTRERVMADGQRLAVTAEEHLLVSDKAGKSDRVDVDSADIGAARTVELFRCRVR